MQSDNANVVKKFIFRYLSVPLNDGLRNILENKRIKMFPLNHRVNPPKAD
jgi:hypothetical protein